MTKKLCRIRLINWHYFENETIKLNGSFLISGENTAGKSTILDAIQLVLTTNTRKFNTAANEKSNRNLKGYVRCKTGNEDSIYMRKNSVITYVALEFYEEKTSKYFTLGVKIDSPDEESRLSIRWFREECRLEALSFITDGRPSTTDEFRKDHKKIYWITRSSDAKARFGQRLGNLEDRFFDMIPKSLAFKPMDNVKEFINKFILSEKSIEVSTLRSNIATLKELEDLMTVTKEKMKALDNILLKNEDIITKDKEIKTNEILIEKAKLESEKQKDRELKQENHILLQKLKDKEDSKKHLNSTLENERKRLTSLQVALEKNETTKLISDTKHRIEILEGKQEIFEQGIRKLQNMLDKVTDLLTLLDQQSIFMMTKQELLKVASPEIKAEDKAKIIYHLKQEIDKIQEKYNEDYFKMKDLLEAYSNQKLTLEKEIKDLKNKKLTYPENTIKLKMAIEKEFLKQKIDADVRIFSDLLEVTDSKWQNAVEGYLNTQRFYIMVEPKYYKIALEVYHQIRKEVHTVGLVNTEKLNMNNAAAIDSLAYVVKSDNRYAKAYATYLLNRVIRCNDIHSLKDHPVAITSDCMLYQNYAVRKINEAVYKTPFIGAHAYKIQLKNKETELIKLNEDIKTVEVKQAICQKVRNSFNKCKIDDLEEHMNGPKQLKENSALILKEKIELKKAESNPSYIEIQLQITDCKKDVDAKQNAFTQMIELIGKLKNIIELNENTIENNAHVIKTLEKNFKLLCDQDVEITILGINKFNEQVKIKSPTTIMVNFSPLKVGLENKKDDFSKELMQLQSDYCSKYDCDHEIGNDKMDGYIQENHKLITSDIIKYEDDLKKAKDNCELEFRESFLARLKENIENARREFQYLNAALKGIYYGEDSYKFVIKSHKQKQSIYEMIMSEDNVGGFTIWSGSFQEKYKEEMEDLFAKLTAYDDQGEKVLAEYTDYRSYLDYDIRIEKRDGRGEDFSKTYGEKSGGETQTPYYVAIAASFVQLYKRGDTIRIIMLDEAFDKMDDDRIGAMMDFFNSQNLQIILATPPAKMEVIGEKVDTILMAMREGSTSIIEEYDL